MLKYGMFIHFGMSTFTEREIDNGDQPSTTYAPTDLDVDQWIRVARDAGMKYAVLTSKHVAGHCLWDSKVQFRGNEFDYDVATSGNKTDVVAKFVTACKKYGLTPGLYWRLLDFRNNSVPHGPQWNAGNLPSDFFQLAQDQLAELITNYPDIGYYWFDIPRAATPAKRAFFMTWPSGCDRARSCCSITGLRRRKGNSRSRVARGLGQPTCSTPNETRPSRAN